MSDWTLRRESDVNNADTHDRRPPKRARAMTDAALDAAPDEGEGIEEEVSEEEVARARRRWLVRTLERRLRRDDLRARRRRRYARRRREAMKGTARPRDDDTPEDTPEAEIFRMRRFLRTYEHTRELEDSLIALGYMAEAERFRFGVDPARVREALRELEDAVASRPPGCA